MTRLARAFVAVTPPADVLDALAARQRTLAAKEPRLRCLPRQQLHVTLQFLGTVDNSEALAETLAAALQTTAPFRIQLAGAGAFPSPRRATVLWIGIKEGGHELGVLAATTGDAAARHGHRPEPRAYHPHLTIARASPPRPVTTLVDAVADDTVGPAWAVTGAALVESDTRPDGAIHTIRARLPFAPANP